MQINILSENENPLFNRKEVELTIESDVVPSRSETIKLISKKFSTLAENIKIKKIQGKFGSRIFSVSANIYPSQEEKDGTELKKKKEKEEEKRAAAQIAEQTKQEEPEVKTEEIKSEQVSEESQVEESKSEEKQEESKE
ncbi:MAG: hypothetical protein KKF68_00905 [Nanoarchaeota archaeon]|nr:hypothetical protein [Nanoarchaeota archaeon]